MLETLIVGAGLCGLELARRLQSEGRDYLLLEARQRTGGRIESLAGEGDAVAVDLGPTWFWPATQPAFARLVERFGLASFPQHDEGIVLHLERPDDSPKPLAQERVHLHAHRIRGGMGELVRAMQATLPPERLQTGCVLKALVWRETHVEALLEEAAGETRILARRAVLALPPRLVAERIVLEPALPAELAAALEATPTWMAAQCKAVMRYREAFWRKQGLAGNAFVTHPQAVLGEIFDACDADGRLAALGGLSAIPASARQAFSKVFDMMLRSLYAQLFGPAAAEGELIVRDWALEAFTCSTLDHTRPASHPQDGVKSLARPQWDAHLFLGGSETAGQSAGYLEGALEAAARIHSQLRGIHAEAERLALPGVARNHAGIEAFAQAVAILRAHALGRYVDGIRRARSGQKSQDMTQIVLVEVAAQTYARALEQLRELDLDLSGAVIEAGRVSLTPALLAAFSGFADELLRDAQAHNGRSCAISNFPLEHNLNQAYLQAIRRDLAAQWREFALALNDELANRMERAALDA